MSFLTPASSASEPGVFCYEVYTRVAKEVHTGAVAGVEVLAGKLKEHHRENPSGAHGTCCTCYGACKGFSARNERKVLR